MDTVVWKVSRELDTLGLSEVERTIIKATYEDDFMPKEKHVLEIVGLSRSGRGPQVVSQLRKRFRHPSWKVVLKTQAVLHRVCREGSSGILEDLSHNPETLDLRGYEDRTPEGHGYSPFVVNYSLYLSEKAAALHKNGFCVERRVQDAGTDWAKKVPPEELFKHVEACQYQFKVLLNCEVYVVSSSVHPIMAAAMIELLKDSFHLYSYFSMVVFVILDQFPNWGKSLCKQALEFVKAFVELNAAFKKWAVKCTKLEIVDHGLLPDFDQVPSTIGDSLEMMFKEQFGAARKGSTKKGKEKSSSKKKRRDEEDEDEDEEDADESKTEVSVKQLKDVVKGTKLVVSEKTPSTSKGSQFDLLGSAHEPSPMKSPVKSSSKKVSKKKEEEDEDEDEEESEEEEVAKKPKKKSSTADKKSAKPKKSKKSAPAEDDFASFFGSSSTTAAPAPGPAEGTVDILDLFSSPAPASSKPKPKGADPFDVLFS